MTSNKLLLETVTGKLVDVIDPTEDQICINDIAWGLSRIPRFAGHTLPAIPYNVAQHSLLVFNEVRELLLYGTDNPLQKSIEECESAFTPENNINHVLLKALLHDAAEVYIGDVPSPVKKHPKINAAIKEIEANLINTIFSKFDLLPMTEAENEIIHHADLVARAIEAHAFMQSRGRDWHLPEVSLIKLQKFEQPKESVVSYTLFLETFNALIS